MSLLVAGLVIMVTLFRVLIPSQLPPLPKGGTPYRKKKEIKNIQYEEKKIDEDFYYPTPAPTEKVDPYCDSIKTNRKKTEKKVQFSKPKTLTTIEYSQSNPYAKIGKLKGVSKFSLASSKSKSNRINSEKSSIGASLISLTKSSSLIRSIPALLRQRNELQKAMVYAEILRRKHF